MSTLSVTKTDFPWEQKGRAFASPATQRLFDLVNHSLKTAGLSSEVTAHITHHSRNFNNETVCLWGRVESGLAGILAATVKSLRDTHGRTFQAILDHDGHGEAEGIVAPYRLRKCDPIPVGTNS